MKIIRKIEIDLVQDRKILKWRINLIKNNVIIGCLKPVA